MKCGTCWFVGWVTLIYLVWLVVLEFGELFCLMLFWCCFCFFGFSIVLVGLLVIECCVGLILVEFIVSGLIGVLYTVLNSLYSLYWIMVVVLIIFVLIVFVYLLFVVGVWRFVLVVGLWLLI